MKYLILASILVVIGVGAWAIAPTEACAFGKCGWKPFVPFGCSDLMCICNDQYGNDCRWICISN